MTFQIKNNEPLDVHTTFKVGGSARFFAEVFSKEDLLEVISFAEKENLEIIPLGGGSNTLFKDGLHNQVVIKISIDGIFENIFGDKIEIKAGAGVNWDKLVSYSCEKGFWGFENLSHIPGTVGGACVQNIGAYGAELKDTVKEIFVYDLVKKSFVTLKKEECAYGYRDSFFKSAEGKKYLILGVVFILSKKPDPKISYKDLRNFFGEKIPQSPSEVREAVISIRSKKFPSLKEYGTAGSFFKNPIVDIDTYKKLLNTYPDMPAHETDGKMKLSAAWILDKAVNLKGYCDGDVSLWKDQPLVVVNHEGKNSEEIILFVKKIKQIVLDKTGILLEEEVIII